MDSIIKTVENKIKPKSQFINEKQSKFLNLKKKNLKPELSKDKLTQELGLMDIRIFLDPSFSLVSNFMLTANFAFKEDRLHGTKY